MDLNGFNANDVPPAQSFEPLPEGWYTAIITESEQKDTKKGDGSYLALTFEITSGPGEGRKMWANLNLNNPNEKAVEIAQRELSAICHAVNVLAPKRSEDLHSKPLAIHVGQEIYNGETKNKIKGYRAANATPKAAAPANTQTQTKAAPPWGKRTGT